MKKNFGYKVQKKKKREKKRTIGYLWYVQINFGSILLRDYHRALIQSMDLSFSFLLLVDEEARLCVAIHIDNRERIMVVALRPRRHHICLPCSNISLYVCLFARSLARSHRLFEFAISEKGKYWTWQFEIGSSNLKIANTNSLLTLKDGWMCGWSESYTALSFFIHSFIGCDAIQEVHLRHFIINLIGMRFFIAVRVHFPLENGRMNNSTLIKCCT